MVWSAMGFRDVRRAVLSGVTLFSLMAAVPPPVVRAADEPPLPEKILFNRDVRPILSDNCFYCHGPDAGHRQADLRLDLRDEAVESGAITPGDSAESSLLERVLSTDPEECMPPPDSHKTLTERQKQILKLWIEQGAEYQRHWAYEPPVKAEIPAGQNAIDVLVRRRLAEIGLQPSPQADRRTLIRRLYWDLIGLPPTPDEVAAFEQDTSPDAYEKVGGSVARESTLRRTDGDCVAGCGAFCRHDRLSQR